MKAFRVKLAIRNNLLQERREEKGWNQAECARQAELQPSTYGLYEALARSPLRKDGSWRADALRIAVALGASPDDLWPERVLSVASAKAEARIDALPPALMAPEVRQIPTGEDLAIAAEDGARLRVALAGLPERERVAVSAVFGLDGEEHSLGEAGELLGVGRERARQLAGKAVRGLRHTLRESDAPPVAPSPVRPEPRKRVRRLLRPTAADVWERGNLWRASGKRDTETGMHVLVPVEADE